MKNSRIVVLATCCAMAAQAWANAGLTSAGVDPTVGNNNAQAEPTLAQVAPVTGQQGQPGGGSAGVVLPATATGAGGAAQAAGAAGQHAANGAAADASKSATAAVVAPAPPPPPPDPSTLPVSVIRPLNKAPESTAPPAAESTSDSVASKTKPARQPLANAPAEPIAAPPPPHVVQPAPARPDMTRATGDTPAAPAAATSATADGSANGYVFYTGVGIAGIILALSFAGFMRAGNGDSGRPHVKGS